MNFQIYETGILDILEIKIYAAQEVAAFQKKFWNSFCKCSDLSTLENCLPWDFDYNNSIHKTSILGDAIENSLASKLLTSEFLKKLGERLEYSTKLAFSWNYVAITKLKQR